MHAILGENFVRRSRDYKSLPQLPQRFRAFETDALQCGQRTVAPGGSGMTGAGRVPNGGGPPAGYTPPGGGGMIGAGRVPNGG